MKFQQSKEYSKVVEPKIRLFKALNTKIRREFTTVFVFALNKQSNVHVNLVILVDADVPIRYNQPKDGDEKTKHMGK